MLINDAFPLQTGMQTGATAGAADNIQIRTLAGGYEVYFLSNGLVGKGGVLVPAVQNKWTLSTAVDVVATRAVGSGTPAWYLSRNATALAPVELTVAGQVASDATASTSIAAGLNLIANPYTTAYAINSQDWVAMGGVTGASPAAGDNIQIQTPAGGYSVYFLSNGLVGKGGILVPAVQNKWTLSTAVDVPSTAELPIGAAAWYIHRGAGFNWNQSLPYSF
jgi:hypothetical protein